jgi:hypothetical protein
VPMFAPEATPNPRLQRTRSRAPLSRKPLGVWIREPRGHPPDTPGAEDLTMPLVAVTRLRIRSFRFLLPFAWHTWRSFRQAKQAAGSLGVKLRIPEGLAF